MIPQQITIESASAANLPEILALLSAADLPHEGVNEHLHNFLVARSEEGTIVGCIGMERHEELRSEERRVGKEC